MSPLNLTQAEREEAHGLYWEAVGKLVDGVEVDIANGHLKTRDAAEAQLTEAVQASEWVEDNHNWAVHTLLWSKHPCAQLGYSMNPKRADDDPFPFSTFAERAMLADAIEVLGTRELWQKLP